MTEYYFKTINGDMCRINEKRIGLLLSEIWQDIRQDNISLIRYPDGLSEDDLDNNRASFDYAVYTHGKDSKGIDIVIRYYVNVSNDGRFATDPIELSYSTFVNDLIAYGDTLTIEDSKTGETLNTFAINRGA